MFDHRIAYVAGFFDGEGSINISCSRPKRKNTNPQYALKVSATQLVEHREPLDYLYAAFGGHLSTKDKKRTGRPLMQWTSHGDDALVALRAMLPYFSVKRDVAMLGLAFQRLKEHYRANRKIGEPMSQTELEIGAVLKQACGYLNGKRTQGVAPA